MKTSQSIKEISSAFLNAQKEIGAASKSAKNPFFKSKYADLNEVIETIKEPLNSNDISFLQTVDIVSDTQASVINTILLHKSGEFISAETPIIYKNASDPQSYGAGITYAKRYALAAICGLPTEDDDGETAMGRGRYVKKENIAPEPPGAYGEKLNALVVELAKSNEDIKNMISWARGRKEDSLETLSSTAQMKLITALEKQKKDEENG